MIRYQRLLFCVAASGMRLGYGSHFRRLMESLADNEHVPSLRAAAKKYLREYTSDRNRCAPGCFFCKGPAADGAEAAVFICEDCAAMATEIHTAWLTVDPSKRAAAARADGPACSTCRRRFPEVKVIAGQQGFLCSFCATHDSSRG